MSPYSNNDPSEFSQITDNLIDDHPLRTSQIVALCQLTWEIINSTKIGTSEQGFLLKELDPPAQIIGYLFEKIFCALLNKSFPNEWRNGDILNEKDVVYEKDNKYSFEIKSSGQKSLKIYGNRSYGKSPKNSQKIKKDKSGYYLAINFYKDKLELIRFGWIDQSDWLSQKSETGQQSHLDNIVYEKKLKILNGDYLDGTDLELFLGKNKKIMNEINTLKITSIRQLLNTSNKYSEILQKKLSYINSLMFSSKQ